MLLIYLYRLGSLHAPLTWTSQTRICCQKRSPKLKINEQNRIKASLLIKMLLHCAVPAMPGAYIIAATIALQCCLTWTKVKKKFLTMLMTTKLNTLFVLSRFFLAPYPVNLIRIIFISDYFLLSIVNPTPKRVHTILTIIVIYNKCWETMVESLQLKQAYIHFL